jgi:thioredoxin 1
MVKNDKVPELTAKEFEEFTKKGFVLVDFFAEWCMPCLMMAPILDELSDSLKGKIKFGKINVGEHQDLAQKFNVSSIPNFILFKDGKQVKQFVGAMSQDEFEERLKSYI